jgi:putative Mg2+ transporter-C (MgtC) family protein
MDSLLADVFEIPNGQQMLRVVVRVLLAAVLCGLLGAEREKARKPAGLRTHMLVALGAAVFALFPVEAGMSIGDLSRVIQGVAAGIGFIGAGTILKRADADEVSGLTTAASVWLTAAIGLAVGAGHIWLPIVVTATAWSILYVVARFTGAGEPDSPKAAPSSSGHDGARAEKKREHRHDS